VAGTDGIRVWTLGGMPVVSTPDELDLIYADDLTAALRPRSASTSPSSWT
jgi:hypothetical protein